MKATTIPTSGDLEALLEAARGGDERAFTRLVEPHRNELNAHCYRMLGSLHDGEDALQETMLRAWRGLPRFEGRSSLRSWLYTIATNTCLNAIERRPKRVHPIDYGPRADPSVPPGEPVVETVWIEPYPDEQLAVPDGELAPEARYEQREALELAFIAALQLLPANQRAALILREVLGYSARETAATLETSVAAVNSALQRARATLEDRLPDRSQQQTLRVLGDERVREVIDAYVEAWDRTDIDGVVSMLSAEATFSMPPLSSWYGGAGGHAELAAFFAVGPLSGEWRWRHLPVRVNGQPTLAFYCWNEDAATHLPFALNVLTLAADAADAADDVGDAGDAGDAGAQGAGGAVEAKIADVTCFVARTITSPDPATYARWPDEPLDQRRLEDFFLRFGLPDRLD